MLTFPLTRLTLITIIWISGLTAALTTAGIMAGKILFTGERDVLAYVWVVNGQPPPYLHVYDLHTHQTLRYPSVVSADWSSDGRKLVFAQARYRDQRLHVLDFDQRRIQQLTLDGVLPVSAAWSPDASQIVYSVSDNIRRILLMKSDGSDSQLLLQDNTLDHSLAWSPDGKQLVFSTVQNSSPDIYLFNFITEQQYRLTDDQFFDHYPAWSPDGTQIAYISDRQGGQVYIMDIATRIAYPITDTLSIKRHPHWSADGTRIDYFNATLGAFFVIDLATGVQQRLLSVHGSVMDATWRPSK